MKKFITAIVLLLSLYSCAKNNNIDMDPGSIYGVVTLKSTAEPMRATGVELYTYANGSKGALLAKTVTYDDGHYEFNDIIPDRYYLSVDAQGYDKVLFLVQVQSGKTVHADMQLVETETYMTVRTIKPEPLSSVTFLLSGEYEYWKSDHYATKVWFYYSQSPNNMVSGHKITANTPHDRSYGVPHTFNVEHVFSPGTWYIQAYAENDLGVSFGEIHEITVSEEPSVKTLEVTNITSSSAVLNAYIDYEGNPAYEKRGFVYSSYYSSPTLNDPSAKTTNIEVSGRGKEFSVSASITSNSTYYARPYTVNSQGVYYGRTVEFKYEKVYVLSSSKLEVQLYDISGGATWYEAQELCGNSNVNGHTDWRVPSYGECDDLYDCKSTLGIKAVDYWTCNRLDNYYAYCYDFGDPYNNRYRYVSEYKSYPVRCVRPLK